MLKFKSFVVIIHIAGWLLFMAFPLFFLNNHGQNTDQFLLLSKWPYWLFCITFMVLFYINANVLIPWFFLKKRYVDYSIAVFALFTAVYFLQPFDKLLRSSEDGPGMAQMNRMPPPPGMQQPPPGRFGPPPDGPPPNGEMRPPGPPPGGFDPGAPRRRHIDSTSLFIFVMIMALSTATKTIQQWLLTEQRATQAEADKASAELSFLKAQINPHFLFNTLNNIYTLAIIGSQHTADSIMKLSNIMRYVTDEATENFVDLQNEIDCISDYIELQKLRIGESTAVNFGVTGNTMGKKIVPLVLMTFIENVFKYGVSKNIRSEIDINIDIGPKAIYFECENQIFNTNPENQRAGIGIKNTKQRLEHLYANKHLLNITQVNSQYKVQLTIQA
jgi:two-component system LytT family sensor kinase